MVRAAYSPREIAEYLRREVLEIEAMIKKRLGPVARQWSTPSRRFPPPWRVDDAGDGEVLRVVGRGPGPRSKEVTGI
jgi:hypothetical protein